MDLFDKNGNPVPVATEHVTDALLSGQYGLPQGTQIPVQKADGTIGQVSVEDFSREAKEGAVPISHEEFRNAQLQEQHGGLLEMGKTAAEGAARGATFGGSDVLAGAIGGDEYRKAARERKEANPLTAGASELAGTVAPALLSGGASEGASALATGAEIGNAAREAGMFGKGVATAGKFLAAPTEAVSQIGGLFERGVQGIVGKEGTNLAAKMAQDAAALGVRGAAEGAAYGTGSELSDQALQDGGELSGQKLLAAAGHGALLGGMGGGLLGAATPALSKAGEFAGSVVGRGVQKFDGAAEEQATRALFNNSDKSAMRNIAKLGEDDGVKGGAKVVGRYALDNGIVQAGDTVETILPKAQAAVKKEGTAIGNTLKQADALEIEGPSVANVYKSLNEGVISKLEKTGSLNSGAIGQVRGLIADMAKQAGVPGLDELEKIGPQAVSLGLKEASLGFEQAQQLRRDIDSHINFNTDVTGKKNAVAEALKSVRGTLEDEIESALRKGDKTLSESYLEAKKSFAIAKTIETTVTRSATSRASNRFLSPSDYGIGGAIGAGLTGAGAGPLGLAAGIASSLGHHYIREHGNSTAAVALDKLAQLGAVRRAAMTVDREVDKGIAKIAEKGTASPSLHDLGGSFEDKRAAVARAAANDNAHEGMVTTAANGLRPHANGTADAFASAAKRAVAYLSAALPPQPPSQGLLPQKASSYKTPADQQLSFVRKFDAVNDPTAILTHVHDGSLTADELEAVKTTHPDVLAEMQTKTRDALSKMDPDKANKMPLTKKMAIASFLGAPIDAATSPQFVQSVQQTYSAPVPKPQSETMGNGPKRKLDLSSTGLIARPPI